MNKFYLFLLVFVLLLFTCCQAEESGKYDDIEDIISPENDKEFDKGSSIVFSELNNQLVSDLELLCRIWGFLKYHHPIVGEGKCNWDYELFRILPKYLQARNTEERDKVILSWIDKFGKISVCTSCKETPSDAFIKPNLNWMENSNMNNALKSKIREIYQNRHQGEHYYVRKQNNADFVEIINERPYNFYNPDAGFRLLALFRFWNIIHYYFPHKHLTDMNWDDVISKYLPLFILATNRLEYEMAALQLIGETNDSQAYFYSGDLEIQEVRGAYFAPFRVWFIEGKLVVMDYYNPELTDTTCIKIGDVITHINSEPVESIIEKQKFLYPASNKTMQLRNMSFDMLRSTQNTLNIQTEQNGQQMIQLYYRSALKYYGISVIDKVYHLIDGNIGYARLSSINMEDIQKMKNIFENTDGIIIDLRYFPSITNSLFFAQYFASTPTPFAKLTLPNINNPGEFTFSPTYIMPKFDEPYQGKLIVIVNEYVQYHTEYLAMNFQAGSNTTIIGSTTSGANGNVSNFFLPGGLKTGFVSSGIYYPDGTPTQRIGIILDVWVEPTIEGIREGKDELLEKAIRLINE